MTQTEYEHKEQKKLECYRELREQDTSGLLSIATFEFIFDRAYILGKEKETITKEEIEKVAKEYAAEVDKNVRDLYGIENQPTSLTFGECAAESFREGVKFALGKETETIAQEDIEKAAEAFATPPMGNGGMFTPAQVKQLLVKFAQLLFGKQEKDTVIQGWVAVDDDGDLFLYRTKPARDEVSGMWMSGECPLDVGINLFPDLTWDSDPEEVEIIIKRKKK